LHASVADDSGPEIANVLADLGTSRRLSGNCSRTARMGGMKSGDFLALPQPLCGGCCKAAAGMREHHAVRIEVDEAERLVSEGAGRLHCVRRGASWRDLAEAVTLVLEANRQLAEEALGSAEVIREPFAIPAA
jgi:hypothetical protein